jgi:hypothetical protein
MNDPSALDKGEVDRQNRTYSHHEADKAPCRGSRARLRVLSTMKTVALIVTFVAALAGLTSTALGAQEDERAPVRHRAPTMYWGAHIGDLYGHNSEAPWKMANADAFEANTGKSVSLIEFALPWSRCSSNICAPTTFPTAQLEAIRERGAIPLLGWASNASPVASPEQPAFALRTITSGKHDRYIESWAEAARSWGKPFFLRFDWEMNLRHVLPYNEGSNGNRPGEFVRAWRHVHRIFREAGVDNVSWVWCPNAEYPGSVKPLERLYPGGRFVDWTCIDSYNWGENPFQPDVWRSFDTAFSDTYRHITRKIAPFKPLLIGETASSEIGGDKAAWITDMLRTQVSRGRYSSHLRGFVWFNRFDRGGLDWQIETSTRATAAFRSGIARSYFANGAYGEIVASPIPPLAKIKPRRCGNRCQKRWAP